MKPGLNRAPPTSVGMGPDATNVLLTANAAQGLSGDERHTPIQVRLQTIHTPKAQRWRHTLAQNTYFDTRGPVDVHSRKKINQQWRAWGLIKLFGFPNSLLAFCLEINEFPATSL